MATHVRGLKRPSDVLLWWHGTNHASLRAQVEAAMDASAPHRIQRAAAGLVLALSRACPSDEGGQLAAWLDAVDVPEEVAAEVEREPHGAARAAAWRARRRSPGLA